jgi:ABC-2 type transport system permease protein
MSRSAVLAGRTLADLARSLAVVVVMAGIGFAVGFRVHTSALAFLAGLALVALFGYALSWGCVSLGLRISDPGAAQAAGVPVMFLLVFASGAFVPISTMPGWLQAVAAHQPLTALVTAVRALVLGRPDRRSGAGLGDLELHASGRVLAAGCRPLPADQPLTPGRDRTWN